ncbi:MAG: MraY family glycosyltransferase [Verrucomicrobiota bacterium]
MILSLTIFAASFLFSVVVTVALIRFWKFPFGMDYPDKHRKKHTRPMLRLGGIPVFGAYAVVMGAVPWYLDRAFYDWAAILGTSLLMFLLGLADDFKPIGARKKLLGQVLIGLLAYYLGLNITNFSYPVGNFSMSLGGLALIATVAWFIAVPNIINLIDGVDGLAAGLGFFLYLMLGYVAWSGGSPEIAYVSFAVAGALLGFLCFNFPPAKIFLGDGGAYFIGFGIAALSLQCSEKGSVAAVLLVTVIALGLPIMDTLFALMRRAVRGFPIFRADAEHIHHRLRKLGFSERRLVLLMYFVTVFFSLMALSVFWTQGRTLPVALGCIFLLIVLAVRYLGYVWRWEDLNHQLQKAFGRRQEVQYVLAYARIAELEVDQSESLDEFEQVFEKILRRCGYWLQPQGNPENWQEFQLKYRKKKSLTLWRRQDKHAYAHHIRLADCFRDAYQAACLKWEVSELFIHAKQ